jgi:type III secretion protein J
MMGKIACWGLMACLLLLAGCDQRTELTRVQSEKEANRILVVLESRGVTSASKQQQTEQRATVWSISVSQEELSSARAILVQNDLPREDPGGFATMIAQGGLIPTKQQERAKMMYAMAGELEKTLSAIDRVVVARVHVVLPENDPFQRSAATRPSASAMVLLKYTPLPGETATALPTNDHSDAPIAEGQVQQMVARSVEGLLPDDVFVTFTRSMPLEFAAAPAPMAAPPAASSGGETSSGLAGNRSILLQLLGAVAGFGLLSIILTALLVKEKRKARLAMNGTEPA